MAEVDRPPRALRQRAGGAARSAADPEPLIAIGRWEGTLLAEPRGGGGFGYDPLLYIPELGRSVAELDAGDEERSTATAPSPRGSMLALMREVWRAAAGAGG